MDDGEPVEDDGEPVETAGQRAARDGVEDGAIVGLATIGGLVLGGPLGVVVGAVVGVGAMAWRAWGRKAGERIEQVVSDGVNQAGMPADQFPEWVEDDLRHQGLLLAVVEAAARSTTEAHLDALARVLADGIRASAHDEARLDVDTLIARALGDLGPAHLQVLFSLSEDMNTYRTTGVREEEQEEWGADHLASRHPRLADGIDALMATLTAHGCAQARSGGFGGSSVPYYIVTRFGRACLAYLDNHAQAS